MKNLKFLILGSCFTMFASLSFAQNPTMDWVHTFGGTSDENPQACRLDNSGHVYTVGYFEGTVDFDPTAGVTNLTSNGSPDIYIQKLDTMGNFIWAKSIGGTSWDIPYGIAFDANDNIHITGYYWNTVDFDPGPGVANISSVGSDDAFVLKLDPDGNYLWAKSFGGSSQERGYDIQVDASGNVYSTGSLFSWTADFDPNAGVFNLGITTSNCPYISKLDPNGNFIWAKQFTGSAAAYPTTLALDPNGNPIAGGRFFGTCDFDPSAATSYLSASGQDGWVAKLTSAGVLDWAQRIGGSGTDLVDGIDVDATGNLLLCGAFSNTTDFDLGPGTAYSTSASSYAGFVLKTDATLGYQWHADAGSNSFDWLKDVATDNSGNVYASGILNGVGLVRKWTSSGVQDWSLSITDYVMSLDVDQNELAYITGYFTGTKNFDPFATQHTETSTGGRDAFVHKIIPACTPTTIAPDVASLATQTINCGNYPDPIGSYPTATNDCGDQVTGTPNVTFPITTSGTTTITWSYDDGEGNTTSQTQDVTINDANPIAVCQDAVVMLDMTGNGTLLLAQVENGSSDDCGIASTVLSQTAFDCSEQGANTITMTVTDNNGNTDQCVATITVVDDIDPTTNPPMTINVECSGNIPAPDINEITGLADNCAGPITVLYAFENSDGLTCPETITRTYAVADAYGNTIFVDQLIIVDDVTPPTASNPNSVNANCGGNVPAPDVLVITDEADNCSIPTVTFVSDVSDGLSNPETITRTYAVTDDCGNSINVTQLIIVQDNAAPTASNPAPVNVECHGDIPAPDVLVVNDESDDCSIPVVAFVSDISDGLTCPETITRTYSVTDDGGNSISVTQTITVDDVTPPTASNPAGINVECIGDIPAPDVLVVSDENDNCSIPVVAFVSEISDGLSCPETITRTYSVTDDCGNTINVTQTITVQDITPPVIGPIQADVTVECIGDVPAMQNASWTDNCDGSGTVAGTDVSDGLSCPETITRTWTYTDNCGNTASSTQIITVHDITVPVMGPIQADVTVECAGDIPAMTDATWTDNCDGSGLVTGVDVSDGLSCPETITRTWTYTDNCGNTASSTQTITVHDITPPTASLPAPLNHECPQCVPAPNPNVITDAMDNCTSNPIVAFVTEVSDGLSNPETITRTYSVTDDCGNEILVDQIITINDTEDPVPDELLLPELLGECEINEPFPPTATDFCSGTILGTPDVLFPITANGLTVITWTYDDGNGNILTQTQDAWNTPVPFTTTISNNGNVLTSDETNADYQWIDCDNGNAPIAGQISTSFIPSSNGNYAVQLSRNGCVEITPCVTVSTIGINELDADLIQIFPNPASITVQIKSAFAIQNIKLINAMGAIVRESKETKFNIQNLPTGMYFVSVLTDQGTIRSKLIIE